MNKNKWIYIGIIILLLGGIWGIFSIRVDLTSDKRYTPSRCYNKNSKIGKKPIKIEVYLKGDFPASFKQLQNETQFLLEEFKKNQYQNRL